MAHTDKKLKGSPEFCGASPGRRKAHLLYFNLLVHPPLEQSIVVGDRPVSEGYSVLLPRDPESTPFILR